MRVDRTLIARLERSAADYELAVADAYRAGGAGGVRAERFADGALVAQGPGRYVNRALGISLADFGAEGFERLEAFFAAAGVDPTVEVSSWAAPAVVLRAGERGYRPDWFAETFARPLAADPSPPTADVTVRAVSEGDLREWQRIFTAAFGYDTPASLEIARFHTAAILGVAGTTHFLADVDGRPAGCGSLFVDAASGVAWLGGTATVLGFRGRGVQHALVAHRLAAARAAGAELAATTAAPDSASARNLRRASFVPAHTRLVMRRRGSRPPTG